MAIGEIQAKISVKKRWFFWPMYYAGMMAAKAGVDPDTVAGAVVRHGLDVKVAVVAPNKRAAL